MSTDRIFALEQRLTQLERQRRTSIGLVVLSLAMLVASQTTGPHAQGAAASSTVKAPFSVVDARGQTIFSITQAGSETKLQFIAQDRVTAGLSASEDASVLFLSGKKGFARMGMDFAGAGTGPSLTLNDGSDVLTVGSEEVSINAPLKVSPGDSPTRDTIAVNGTLSVRNSKGLRGVTVGATGVRVHGADGVAVATSLGVDDAGKGRLVVGLPTGPRGVLAQPSGGGISLALFDAPGTQYRIGMLAVPSDVAFFRMNSGKQQATMIADTTHSAVNLFNASGHAAASLSSKMDGNGQLELGDNDGDTTVEATTTSEGLGVVRVGPSMGGVVGSTGSLPWALLGKKGK